MGLLDRVFGLDKLVEAKVAERTTELGKTITDHLDTKISKTGAPTSTGKKNGAMRYTLDPVTQERGIYSRRKPDSSVSFDVLRKFSVQHEVSRAAINYRKRQIAGLEWSIVSTDTEDTTDYKQQTKELERFFRGIGGAGNKYRKFINKVVEDLLVLDAVALYRQPTLGGKLYDVLPIDATTIRLRVDETGGTPLPPEIAYKQVIRGTVVAEYTTDEMFYDMMNPRTNTPYGLAPLESLMIIVSSSLKAGLWNLGYLTEGNIPEGFFSVPKEWTPQMIQDFQENWDAVMAGDEAATSKLKFTPEGAYQPSRKMSDMAWQEFNDWLMKVTCALFDVPPSEIGFTSNKGGLGDKGSNQIQADAAQNRGLEPLAHFIEEIFTTIVQEDFGLENLKFEYTGLAEDEDAKLEAEVAEIKIRSGQRTLNEIRTDQGLDPFESPEADKLMIVNGTPTFIKSEEEIAEGKAMAEAIASGGGQDESNKEEPASEDDTPPDNTSDTEKMVALVSEFRKFRKMAIARKKADKSFRPFESTLLPQGVIEEMNERIHKAESVDEVKHVFNEFMQDYQINFIADVVELQSNLQKILR